MKASRIHAVLCFMAACLLLLVGVVLLDQSLVRGAGTASPAFSRIDLAVIAVWTLFAGLAHAVGVVLSRNAPRPAAAALAALATVTVVVAVRWLSDGIAPAAGATLLVSLVAGRVSGRFADRHRASR